MTKEKIKPGEIMLTPIVTIELHDRLARLLAMVKGSGMSVDEFAASIIKKWVEEAEAVAKER